MTLVEQIFFRTTNPSTWNARRNKKTLSKYYLQFIKDLQNQFSNTSVANIILVYFPIIELDLLLCQLKNSKNNVASNLDYDDLIDEFATFEGRQ